MADINLSRGKKLIVWLLTLLLRSLRIQNNSPPARPALIITWHEELLATMKAGAFQENYSMASASKDGESAFRLGMNFGFRMIRGSSNKKSYHALKQLLKLQKTERIYLTADGSRGPRRVIKRGTVFSAMTSGVPVYCARAVYRGFRINSWDRQLIPFPFTKVRYHYTEPIHLTGLSLEEAIDTVTIKMNELGREVNDPECT